jgi:bifunctional non-homologous end joining protein LigD
MSPAGEPMKAKLTDRAFDDPNWVFERKLDGIRASVRREGEEVRLTSRTGRDLSSAYPELVEALASDRAERFLADGEIVAFDGARTSFERLQAGLPLRRRKAALRRALAFAGPVRYTPHRNEHGERFFREACARGWEGLIAKRADSPYAHGRSGDWLKLKCSFEQELAIGGFTPPQGSRARFGALLVGYYEDGELRFAGKVGTGFSQRTLDELGDRLEALEQPNPPFARGGGLPRQGRWVKPELVGQFAFGEWTRDGKLRHPRFLGLREDKPAREVVRERPTVRSGRRPGV